MSKGDVSNVKRAGLLSHVLRLTFAKPLQNDKIA